MKITKNSDNITIETHIGTWYAIDSSTFRGATVFLLEHEDYGDEAAALIVDTHGNIILEDVWNGFGDLCDL